MNKKAKYTRAQNLVIVHFLDLLVSEPQNLPCQVEKWLLYSHRYLQKAFWNLVVNQKSSDLIKSKFKMTLSHLLRCLSALLLDKRWSYKNGLLWLKYLCVR